jgi:5-methylcytosine-specific restriction protein A
LCWRRDGRKHRERAYSAAQLRARLIDKDWDRTLRSIVERDKEQGNTHTLIVQYEGSGFVYAALIPRDDLMPIWQRQRDISADLIASRKLGRITKNHAMNGSSPTIWLHDNREQQARAVADALWSWPGVVNLVDLPLVATSPTVVDDTFDDCPIDYSQLGRDGGTTVEQTRSGYPRDPKVRSEVIRRAAGSCERENCSESRKFPGFLDVHHILGVGTSDRVWNCVALCPNCHRDAHFAPEREAINTTLLAAVQKKLGSLEYTRE